MRKKKALIGILLLSACFNDLHAQQNFVKGYYVTQQNDTLKGLIATERKENFSHFYFKNTVGANPSKLYMSSVKSLNMDEDQYVTWYGSRNMEYIDRVDISLIKNDGVYRTDTIILKRLYAGHDFSLYFYRDEKDHFFVEKTNCINELIVTYEYLSYWEKLINRSYQIPTYYVHNIYRSQITASFFEKLDKRSYALLYRTELDKYSLLRLFKTLDEF